MKCRLCGKKPVIYMPHHRLALCREHFDSWFLKHLERTVKEFRMFSKDDGILVAVSGGKDSLALWDALLRLGYRADGFYLDLGIGDYSKRSREAVERFAGERGAKLIIRSLSEELGGIPLLVERTGRESCSVCGSVKRYFFNKVAKDHRYAVVVTGHNLDDEASSLLGNLLSWNLKYLGRKHPVLPQEGGFVRKAKPLCRFTEKETALYCLLRGIDYVEEECPFSEGATSIFYKEILNRIEERSPGTKMRFYLEYVRKVLPLFGQDSKESLGRCRVCGEPSPSEVCTFCSLRERVLNFIGTGRSSTG